MSSGENSEWQAQDVRKQRWQKAWQPKFGIKEPEGRFNLSTRHCCWDKTTLDVSARISRALAVVVHFILTNPQRQQPKTIPSSFCVGGSKQYTTFPLLLSKIPLLKSYISLFGNISWDIWCLANSSKLITCPLRVPNLNYRQNLSYSVLWYRVHWSQQGTHHNSFMHSLTCLERRGWTTELPLKHLGARAKKRVHFAN